jgi:hypothetical protein
MPSTTARMPAVELLYDALRTGQPDLWAEGLQDHPDERELRTRIHNAMRRGYLDIHPTTGLFRLTRKGSEFLDAAGPCRCRRCAIHDDPGGCLYRA